MHSEVKQAGPGELPEMRHGPDPAEGGGSQAKPMGLSHASGNSSGQPGSMPEVRHGACEKIIRRPRPKGVKWTCPMHPEVVQDKPGPCPKCGMALEPVTPQVSEKSTNGLVPCIRK